MQIIRSSRTMKKQATNWIWPSSLYHRFPSCPDLTSISVHRKALGRRLSIRDIHSSKVHTPSRPLFRLSRGGALGQPLTLPKSQCSQPIKCGPDRLPLTAAVRTQRASVCYSTLVKHLFCARLHPAPSSQLGLVARTPFIDIVWMCFRWSFL